MRKGFSVEWMILTLGTATSAVAAPQYSVTILERPEWKPFAGDYWEAVAINNHGQVAGSRYFTVMWADGPQYLPTIEGSDGRGYAYDINDAGRVVGVAYSFDQQANSSVFHPALWYGAQGTYLDFLAGAMGGMATGINNQGRIVGVSHFPNGHQATEWIDGVPIELSGDGRESGAWAVNDSGDVVGWSAFKGTDITHAALWSNGRISDLGSLGGSYSQAFALNSHGQIVGESSPTGAYPSHATLWQNGLAIDLGTLGGNASTARAINDLGEIAGYSALADGTWTGFVYTGGQLYDLNDVLDASTGLKVLWVIDINNAGQILGSARQADGSDVAVVLTPVPEPTAGWTLAAIAAVELARQSARRVRPFREP